MQVLAAAATGRFVLLIVQRLQLQQPVALATS